MSKVNAILKQNQNKANSAKSVENTYIQPILFKWVGLLVSLLKVYQIENLNSKMLKIWLSSAKIDPSVISFDYIILGFLTKKKKKICYIL